MIDVRPWYLSYIAVGVGAALTVYHHVLEAFCDGHVKIAWQSERVRLSGR